MRTNRTRGSLSFRQCEEKCPRARKERKNEEEVGSRDEKARQGEEERKMKKGGACGEMRQRVKNWERHRLGQSRTKYKVTLQCSIPFSFLFFWCNRLREVSKWKKIFKFETKNEKYCEKRTESRARIQHLSSLWKDTLNENELGCSPNTCVGWKPVEQDPSKKKSRKRIVGCEKVVGEQKLKPKHAQLSCSDKLNSPNTRVIHFRNCQYLRRMTELKKLIIINYKV